jgi:hypothetical protein
MVRRTVLAASLAAILSACGGPAATVPPSPATVSGQVQIRACGGANRIDQSGCQVRPYAGGALEFQLTPPTGKGSDRLAVTDATGRYSILLPPGTWRVTAVTSATSPQLPRLPAFPQDHGGPRQVIVSPGKSVTADFVYTIQLL